MQQTNGVAKRYIDPTSDWGFKYIFGQEKNKDLTIGFLNSVFEGEFQIKDIRFENTEQIGISEDGKGVIFDIYCTTDEGKDIIVEMQKRSQPFFVERSLYYTARAIVNQGRKNDKWEYKIHPVYTICILDYEDKHLDKGKFRTDLGLADRDTGRMITDKIRITYLVLPNFKKEPTDCKNLLDCWTYSIKNMEKLRYMDVPMIANDPVLRKLAQISDYSTMSPEDQKKYERSIKVMRDNYATYLGAIQEGMEKGQTIGMAEGFAKGRAEGQMEGFAKGRAEGKEEGKLEGKSEGMKEGKLQERLANARAMKAEGLPDELIMKITGLSATEVQEIS